MLIIIVLVFKIVFVEGRVFCQDTNASPWKSLGHACPITCSTVITAVDRLKVADYQYLVNEKMRSRINMSSVDLYTMGQQLQKDIVYGPRLNSWRPHMRRHIKLYNTYQRLLGNENFVDALKIELSKMAVEFNSTCSNMAAGKSFYKQILRNNKCTRRLNKRTDVLERFTRFLNKYADPKYPFDEEMTGIILQKIEDTMNLRFGEVDFKRILSYLRKALRSHGSKTKSHQMFNLQSKNCITIYLPGCYCKTGFVESRGECVKPEDCIASSVFKKYSKRIILH